MQCRMLLITISAPIKWLILFTVERNSAKGLILAFQFQSKTLVNKIKKTAVKSQIVENVEKWDFFD